MKITLNDIYTMTTGLEAICKKDLKVAIAYKLLKLSKNIREEAEMIEESRKALVKKYSTNGEKVDDDKINDFQKDYTELLSQEVEIDFEQIKMDDLGDIKMTVIELSAIEILLA
jgi:hypothetical protein